MSPGVGQRLQLARDGDRGKGEGGLLLLLDVVPGQPAGEQDVERAGRGDFTSSSFFILIHLSSFYSEEDTSTSALVGLEHRMHNWPEGRSGSVSLTGAVVGLERLFIFCSATLRDTSTDATWVGPERLLYLLVLLIGTETHHRRHEGRSRASPTSSLGRLLTLQSNS